MRFIGLFSKKYYASLPSGKIEYGCISDDGIDFVWPEEDTTGSNKWNKKPFVNIACYQINQMPGLGFSGVPVCYRKYPCVVGLYEAQDDRTGYIIPIELVLAKFNQKKEIAFSRATNIVSVLDRGNVHVDLESFYKNLFSRENPIQNHGDSRNNICLN